MRRGKAKWLVIDASIVGAAGGSGAIASTSRHCRDFLSAVLTICHHTVLTHDLQEEWNRHQSNFARRWRVSMVSRKKLHIVAGDPDEQLRARIARTARRERDVAAMSKDYRLIEAALRADLIVVSRDDIVRSLFAAATATVKEMGRIIWVNPDRPEEQCEEWLAAGAKAEPSRMLRSHRGE